MTSILIVDSFKPSLVMTSEACKENFMGVQLAVALTGAEAVSRTANERFDVIIVDFDLPDVDGTTLIRVLRRTHSGPILLTAFPEEVVQHAVAEELFAFSDASTWLAKPINWDQVVAQVRRFTEQRHRLLQRFSLEVPLQIRASGKRATAWEATTQDIGLGGLRVAFRQMPKWEAKTQVTLQLDMEDLIRSVPTPTAAVVEITRHLPAQLARVKSEVVWTEPTRAEAGLRWHDLKPSQERAIEGMVKFSYRATIRDLSGPNP